MIKKPLKIAGLLILVGWVLFCFLPLLGGQSLDVGQIKIVDRHEVLIAHLPKKQGLQMAIEKSEPLSSKLIEALVQVEDQRFWQHWGIDFPAKIRAFKSNLLAKKVVSGGSTLTEQWVKNRYFRSKGRTILQKAREATIAFSTSLFLSKEEILRNYLNDAYFGNQIYGAKTAAYVYFEKSDLSSLNQEEIIILLTLLRAPSSLTTQEGYFQQVFGRVAQSVQYKGGVPSKKFKKFKAINRFPHVTTSILQQVDHNISTLFIKSTIDATLQQEAKEVISYSLDRLQPHHATNGAAYVFQPQTGEILVWQGSRDFYDEHTDGEVNIIEKNRQMGSALKPFIYLYAFLNGAHPDHLIVDLEKDFYEKESPNSIFRPLNYSLLEGGVIPLKAALANSFNVSAVRLLEFLGLESAYGFLSQLGIEFDFPPEHYGLSLALGSPDLTMKNVANTYGVLANGGIKKETSLINEVNGVDIERSERLVVASSEANRVALYHLFSVLSSKTNRSRSFGLNSILNTSIPFAVKTGTTRNFKDNWTFGYHPSLVVATWVGNNDGSSMIDVTGVTGAAPIWHRVVEAAIQQGYVEKTQVDPPSSLKKTLKNLNKSGSQQEVIWQTDEKVWQSDLIEGKFCLEDFYIQNIEPEAIEKIAKLFDFKSFSIEKCTTGELLVDSENKSSQPTIVKPKNNEVFYIKKEIPIELQKIIIKSTEPVVWKINEESYEKTDVIFLVPTEQTYSIEIEGYPEEKRVISINYE